MRPINGRWIGKPGSFDPLHALELQDADNPWGIPSIKGVVAPEVVDALRHSIAYDDWRTMRNKGGDKPSNGASMVHFFTDDYRFETCWNMPSKAQHYLQGADIVLSPDFSMYRDHPRAIWIWNTYRSRWMGAYWEDSGLPVVPTVGWVDASSYDFCFLGLPKRGVVAVSTVGVMSKQDRVSAELFCAGYEEMCRRLKPSMVLCYGEKFPSELRHLANLKTFKPWAMERLRALDKRVASPTRMVSNG